MADDETTSLIKFARRYFGDIDQARRIEDAAIGDKTTGAFHPKAFALYYDMERCYASGAYRAAIVVAFMIIEMHLKKIEGLDGKAWKILREAGIYDEVKWLHEERNRIVHGDDALDFVPSHMFDEKQIAEWRRKAEQAISTATVVTHRNFTE